MEVVAVTLKPSKPRFCSKIYFPFLSIITVSENTGGISRSGNRFLTKKKFNLNLPDFVLFHFIVVKRNGRPWMIKRKKSVIFAMNY